MGDRGTWPAGEDREIPPARGSSAPSRDRFVPWSRAFLRNATFRLMAAIVGGLVLAGIADSLLHRLAWPARDCRSVLTVHPVAISGWIGNPIVLPEDAPEVEKARQAARDAVAKAAAELGHSGPAAVTVQVVSGIPRDEFINASGDADLVVVGACGMSTMKRLLLGSVSTTMLHHARCPVAVIPDAPR